MDRCSLTTACLIGWINAVYGGRVGIFLIIMNNESYPFGTSDKTIVKKKKEEWVFFFAIIRCMVGCYIFTPTYMLLLPRNFIFKDMEIVREKKTWKPTLIDYQHG